MPLTLAGSSCSGGMGLEHRSKCSIDSIKTIVNSLRTRRIVFGDGSSARPQQLLPGWHRSFRPVPATARVVTAAPTAAPLSDDTPAALKAPLCDADEAQRVPAAWAPPHGRPGLYDSEGRLVLKALTLPELEAWCASEGEAAPSNRALQLWRWMYADPPAGSWVRRLEDTMGRQNGFSAKFIEKVGSRVSLDGGLQLSRVVRASDGTRKLVFTLMQGEAAGGSVETVLIPIVRQQGLRDRLTICVSSQVGCAMNCQFCYTGRMGLLGNLTTAQIVEQVVEARRFLALEGDRTQLTNLVFMGMGEPLHNTEAVLAASEIVSHFLGLHISHNKITISTVGLIPEMRKVLARSRVQMALSLHATTDEVRDWIVPVNRRYDLASLTAALEELFPRPQQPAVRQPAVRQPAARDQREDEGQEQGQGQGQQQQHLGSLPGGSSMPQASLQLDAPPSQPSAAPARSHTAPTSSTSAHQYRPSRPAEPAPRWLPPLGGESHGASPRQPSISHECTTSGTAVAGSVSPPAAVSGGQLPCAAAAPAARAATAAGEAAAAAATAAGRSLLVEYTMLHGINDTPEDAQRLADMLSKVHCKVNLIVFNPHAGTRFQPSHPEAVSSFRSALVQRGLVCTIRDSRGDDEMAACGQLGNVGLAFRPSPILEAPERFRPFLLPPAPALASASVAEASCS